MVSNTGDNCLQRQIAKKSSNPKLKLFLSMLISTWLPNNTFYLQSIWLQILVAIDSESCKALFLSFCPDGSQFTQMGSHFAQNTTSNPCSLLSSQKPLSGTPPTPPPNTPFPGLNLKVGKMNYCVSKMDPTWAKCLKSGQNFLKVGKKNLFIRIICVGFKISLGQFKASNLSTVVPVS